MELGDIQKPVIAHAGPDGSDWSLWYKCYLYAGVWLLRTLVSYLFGPKGLHDGEFHVDTPGLGSGKVECTVWKPASTSTRTPLIIVLEGGGFVLGEPKDGKHENRMMADKASQPHSNTGAVVLGINYAKGPEYPYPHALLQCYEVLRWALSDEATAQGLDIDPARVAIGGYSAGGNLTAALSLLTSFPSGPCAAFRQRLGPRYRQVLQFMLYPSYELHTPYPSRWARSTAEVQKASLSPRLVGFMEPAYLPPYILRSQLFVSPTVADAKLLKQLSLPPAIILTGGLDCLKDEARDYADRLEDAGVPVTYKEYALAGHGFSHAADRAPKSKHPEVREDCWNIVISALTDGFTSRE